MHNRVIYEAILNTVTSVEYSISINKSVIFLNLGIEKAYDRISRQFVLTTLHKVQFGAGFCHLVKVLFSNANTTLSVNGFTYGSFELWQSVRQGCPLFPLLFVIVIDPLLWCIITACISLQMIPGTCLKRMNRMYLDSTTLRDSFSCPTLKSKQFKTVAIWVSNEDRPEWTNRNGFRWTEVIEITGYQGVHQV